MTKNQAPRLALSAVVLDSPEAGALADFYRSLLGWETEEDAPGWVKLRSRDAARRCHWETVSDGGGLPGTSAGP